MTAAKKPEWVNMKLADLEKLVVDLANKGNSPEKIGLILRDEHGIPKAKILGKRISKILQENKIAIKSDRDKISEKINTLKAHLSKHKKNHPASRSLSKKLWVLHKLEKH